MYNSPISLFKGIKAQFSTLFQTAANGSFESLITRATSNSNEEKYYIPESLPKIKEWLSKRHFGDFSDKYLQVFNKHFDNGLTVDRDTINDSRATLGGNVEMWIKMLVDTYKSFPDECCQAVLDANPNAFDASAMFATSRNSDTGSNTINNLISGTSSTTYSLAEFEADFVSGKTNLLGFKDKNNKAFNKNAKLGVLVPTHLEDMAHTLLDPQQATIYVSGTKSNPYAGRANVNVNWEQSASDNDWYLFNESASIKPFLIQEREGPRWIMFDDLHNTFIEYGFDFRMGYSVLNPFAIVKINN